MPNETNTDPQDTTPHHAVPDAVERKASGEIPPVDAEQTETSLEELSKTPALEEDEDSLAKPDNS